MPYVMAYHPRYGEFHVHLNATYQGGKPFLDKCPTMYDLTSDAALMLYRVTCMTTIHVHVGWINTQERDIPVTEFTFEILLSREGRT